MRTYLSDVNEPVENLISGETALLGQSDLISAAQIRVLYVFE